MTQNPGIELGDIATTAQFSLCAGGVVRTWTDDGSSRLWSVADAERLRDLQGTGTIARTLREPGRFREAGLLVKDRQVLMLQSRFPDRADDDTLSAEGVMLRLGQADVQADTVFEDVHRVLSRAVAHCVQADEFLVVELGGWDAPAEPYCLFLVVTEDEELLSVIEAAPAPRGSEIWQPHIRAGQPGATLKAPATQDTLGVVPVIMMDALSTWGVQPWDLALTFGARASMVSRE